MTSTVAFRVTPESRETGHADAYASSGQSPPTVQRCEACEVIKAEGRARGARVLTEHAEAIAAEALR